MSQDDRAGILAAMRDDWRVYRADLLRAWAAGNPPAGESPWASAEFDGAAAVQANAFVKKRTPLNRSGQR